jgi:enhancing lycopene biosynthesis protein 2
MKRIAVVLSGCGHKDGAEITESVSTLIALSEFHAEYKVFAPNLDITATDHRTGSPDGKRNVLTEAARIARGNILDLKELTSKNFDAIVFPGGFGAALNLCDFAKSGSHCQVHPEAERVIKEFHTAEKPIGAFCIAPALIARVLGKEGITLTIGNNTETAKEIEKTGALHVTCAVDDYITDREHKIVTSPAYMYDAKPHQVFNGIRRAIQELVEMS